MSVTTISDHNATGKKTYFDGLSEERTPRPAMECDSEAVPRDSPIGPPRRRVDGRPTLQHLHHLQGGC